MAESWAFGGASRDDDGFQIHYVRAADSVELSAFRESLARLRIFSGRNLIGGLTEALQEFNDFFDLYDKTSLSLGSSTFRSTFHRKMGNWLAAFSTYRAHLEREAKALATVRSTLASDFRSAYRVHPEYRLTWQLRNLDQHHPPVGGMVSVNRSSDLTGVKDYELRLHLPTLFAKASKLGKAIHQDQWRECAELWAGRDETVDVREVFGAAYMECDRILARLVHDAEDALITDVVRISTIWGEVATASGAHPCLFTVPDSPDASSLKYEPIERESFGEALVAMNGARQILGLPALDIENDGRFA